MFSFLAITFAIILILYILIKANRNTHNVMINKIDLDQHVGIRHSTLTKQLNVLHLSDLHLENISISPENLFNRLKDEEIDLIAITGDFLDRKRSLPKLERYMKSLQKLEAKFGMYAVFGNHDYVLKGQNFESLRITLEAYGCKTLQNENLSLSIDGTPLNIIGIDDYSTNRSNIESSYANLPGGYNLVLTHDPNIVLAMKEYHFDYLLSGHFHGGQIHWPKPYHLVKMGKLVRLNMIKGLHTQDGKPFYISEGLGQTGVNIRIGSLPEITLQKLTLPSVAKAEKAI